MTRDDLVNDIDRARAELKEARAALRRHDWRERMRVSGTATARVLRIIEAYDDVTLKVLVDAVGWKHYGTVASALSNMEHRGIVERVSRGVYRRAK